MINVKKGTDSNFYCQVFIIVYEEKMKIWKFEPRKCIWNRSWKNIHGEKTGWVYNSLWYLWYRRKPHWSDRHGSKTKTKRNFKKSFVSWFNFTYVFNEKLRSCLTPFLFSPYPTLIHSLMRKLFVDILAANYLQKVPSYFNNIFKIESDWKFHQFLLGSMCMPNSIATWKVE